ncbi:MAG: DUF4349 domain-containing protein [Anaerolineales bacterium]|nr:DUF4349 domain-containing protein [Anaerolineales bacterium]
MLKKLSLITLLGALVLAACAPAATPGAPADYDELQTLRQSTASGGAGAPVVSESYAAADGVAPAEAPKPGAAGNAVERMVIKNANLSLVVKDPIAASRAIAALAEGMGGFVVNSGASLASIDAAGNKYMQANIAVRVPAASLDQALTQIRALAVTGQAETESITGEDVTATYTDLESQLRNLEAAEAQLQQIMAEAKRTEDVLNVFNQLTSIRGQIEQVKGQMQYYSEAAAMSYIGVSLLPDALSQPIEIGGWKAEGVAKEAVEALISALQDLASALIWIGIYLLPLGLLCGTPLFFIGRLAWRRMRRPKPAAVAQP